MGEMKEGVEKTILAHQQINPYQPFLRCNSGVLGRASL